MSLALLLVGAALAGGASTSTGVSAADFGTLTRLAVPADRRILSAHQLDWDGAGRALAVLVQTRDAKSEEGASPSRGAARGPERELWIYPRTQAAILFAAEPRYRIRLTPEVVAFAVGDLHPDPGRELALLTARGVFLWRPSVEDERERLSLLFRSDVLWQWPDGDVIDWSRGCRDIDGDGLDDFLLPTGIGYALALQRRTPEGASFELQLLRLPELSGTPAEVVDVGRPGEARRSFGSRSSRGADRRRGDEEGGSITIGAGGEGGRQLLAVSERVPAPILADWDADGDLDLVAQTSEQLIVYRQGEDGRFESSPGLGLELPVGGADDDRSTDVSYSAHAADLDLDGRMDCVVLASDRDSQDPRTQVLIYLQKGRPQLFGEGGLPSAVLVLAGLAGFPRLVDVDGDGDRDLLVMAFRPDLLDALRSATTRRIEFELHVFQNEGGRFGRKPWLSEELAVPIEGEDFRARFFGDISGDGLSELLVRDSKDHLQVRLARVRSGRLGLEARPLFELSIEEGAELLIPEAGSADAGEFLVLEKHSVTHVRFP